MLDEYPDQLATPDRLNGWLHRAAGYNQVGVMEVLCEYGADVNAPYTDADPNGPVMTAAGDGATDAVRWLLAHGASVTTSGETKDPCPRLSLAAMKGHLGCVKLLVEAGAPLATSGADALHTAKVMGRHEVVEYPRSVGTPEDDDDDGGGVASDEDNAPGKSALSAAGSGGGLPELRRHLELQLLGSILPNSFQEILPSDPPIAVLVLDQFGVRKAIVTEGMSGAAMNGPIPYAELVMYLPADWPLDASAIDSDKYIWPVNWLRRLAHIPHQQGVGYEPVAHLDPDEPLGPGTRLSTLLMLAGDGERDTYVRDDGERVVLITVLAIYPEERDFARREGLKALLTRLHDRGFAQEVRPDRPSVAD